MRSVSRELQRRMEDLPKEASPFAVLHLGLDGFRAVNEQLGHRAGDDLLKLVEDRLRSNIREHEAVLRLTGDEFLIMLHAVTTVQRAGRAADRLHTLVQEPYAIGDATVHLRCCAGLALCPLDGCHADDLLRCAGMALAHAKAAGTGIVQFFSPAMQLPQKKARPGLPALPIPALA